MNKFDLNEIEVIRSKRRTISLEIKPDKRVIVRAPMGASNMAIKSFVMEHVDWIEKHLAKQEEISNTLSQEDIDKLSPEEIKILADEAIRYIPERVAYYAPLVGVTYGRITIRNQRTRWGSCNSKGNLNFNCLLMLTPPEVIDSVVVHELCHRLEMNHSKDFYAHVLRVYPEYKKWDRWLKEHGNAIIKRMI